jgi:hypothetical protein
MRKTRVSYKKYMKAVINILEIEMNLFELDFHRIFQN